MNQPAEPNQPAENTSAAANNGLPGNMIFLQSTPKTNRKDNFDGRTAKILGAVQIVGGVISIVGQAGLTVLSSAGMYGGSGFYAGILFILAGSFGYTAGQQKTSCWISTTMVMCIISINFAPAMLFNNVITLAVDKDGFRGRYLDPYSYGYYSGSEKPEPKPMPMKPMEKDGTKSNGTDSDSSTNGLNGTNNTNAKDDTNATNDMNITDDTNVTDVTKSSSTSKIPDEKLTKPTKYPPLYTKMPYPPPTSKPPPEAYSKYYTYWYSAIAVHSCMLITALVEFITLIVSAVLCCKVMCCNVQTERAMIPVTVNYGGTTGVVLLTPDQARAAFPNAVIPGITTAPIFIPNSMGSTGSGNVASNMAPYAVASTSPNPVPNVLYAGSVPVVANAMFRQPNEVAPTERQPNPGETSALMPRNTEEISTQMTANSLEAIALMTQNAAQVDEGH